MSRKPYDELPSWRQLLWPWLGPPWYEQVEDLDAYLAAFRRALTVQAGELAGELVGDGQPGEGYLAKAGWLTAARHHAEEVIRHQYGPLPPDDEDDGDEDPAPDSAPERPLVIGRHHPSWAEVDTGQRERLGESESESSDTQRVYESAVEPGVLQNLPDNALLLPAAVPPARPPGRRTGCADHHRARRRGGPGRAG
jgi:hypothetical protein